jgi:hypothetical protein
MRNWLALPLWKKYLRPGDHNFRSVSVSNDKRPKTAIYKHLRRLTKETFQV